ncbi:MAG: glycosyltransferase family 4 protein, partial [Candidatus Acidiferrales bacterium]
SRHFIPLAGISNAESRFRGAGYAPVGLKMADRKPRIAVVSPFLDKQHGTERCVTEQLERLATDYEFHVYSTRVADMDLRGVVWHRIPSIPGPHLVKYIWFLGANHVWRWARRVLGGVDADLIYSPGINCLDADLISVHVIFAKFYQSARESLSFRQNVPRFWLRLLHRRLLYRLFISLERRVYTRQDLPLITISSKAREDLGKLYGRESNVSAVYYGVDPLKFSAEVRGRLRMAARSSLGYSEADFVILLIGNDWNNKGLRCLLEAARIVDRPWLKISVVGTDDRTPYRFLFESLGSQVLFFPLRADPEVYYAAADLYVGPSLEDAFALPPLEAMACGVPVIVSRQAGVSELVTHGVDGYILEDPEHPDELAGLIAKLCEDRELREGMGRRAAGTARQYTWERNAEQLKCVFQQLLDRKRTESLPASRPR